MCKPIPNLNFLHVRLQGPSEKGFYVFINHVMIVICLVSQIAEMLHKAITRQQNLDWSKLKQIADDILKCI